MRADAAWAVLGGLTVGVQSRCRGLPYTGWTSPTAGSFYVTIRRRDPSMRHAPSKAGLPGTQTPGGGRRWRSAAAVFVAAGGLVAIAVPASASAAPAAAPAAPAAPA